MKVPKFKQYSLACDFEQKGQKRSQLTLRHTASSTGLVKMAVYKG